jgi:hypothetical protein
MDYSRFSNQIWSTELVMNQNINKVMVSSFWHLVDFYLIFDKCHQSSWPSGKGDVLIYFKIKKFKISEIALFRDFSIYK